MKGFVFTAAMALATVSASAAWAQKAPSKAKAALATEVKLVAELSVAAAVSEHALATQAVADDARVRQLLGKLLGAAKTDVKSVTASLKAAEHTAAARKLFTASVLIIRADKELAKGGSLKAIHTYLVQSRDLTAAQAVALDAKLAARGKAAAGSALIGEDGLAALIGEDASRALVKGSAGTPLLGKSGVLSPKLLK